MTRHYGVEATNALLPGKASKHQVTSNRTPNRHRWSGAENTKALGENSGEGTRQNGAVTSGEGTLAVGEVPADGAEISRRYQLAATVY